MIVSFPVPKIDYSFINNDRVICPKNREEYLDICKKFLHNDVYKEILLSIMDSEFYDVAESQIKKVVDSYFIFKE